MIDHDGRSFSELLTRLRAARGWTKAELAERAGLTASAISRLESAERDPERETVDKLAEGLDLSAVENERFLAAAGFRSPILDDPLVVELLEMLVDPSLPPTVAADVRTLVRVAVAHGRRGRSDSS